MVVWVREGGRRPREGAPVGHSSARKGDREGVGGPAWEARLLGYRGLGRPLLVLGKGPRIPSPERKGGVGSRGMWELGASGPLAGQGWGGVLRHKKPGLLGLSEVGWEEPKLNINSQPAVTFPSVPSHLKRPWVKALPKAERDSGGWRPVRPHQCPKPTSLPAWAQAAGGPGWEDLAACQPLFHLGLLTLYHTGCCPARGGWGPNSLSGATLHLERPNPLP